MQNLNVSLKLPSFVSFFFYACIVSSFFSRIHDLKAGLSLDERGMGFLLLSLPVGVITGALFASHVIDRSKPQHVIQLGMPVFAFFPLLAIQTDHLYVAYVFLFLYGLFSSSINIAINVEAHRIENTHKLLILNKCHGFFSLGFLLFSFIFAYLVGKNVSAEQQFWLVAIAIVVAMLFLFLFQFNSTVQPANNKAVPANITNKKLALPTLPIMLILLYAMFGLILDGIVRSWGIIYAEDVVKIDTALAAYALSFLIVGLSIGRFLADKMISMAGTVAISKILIIITFAGIVFLSTADGFYMTMFGIALIGLGVSTVHPQAIKAVASLPQDTPAQNIAAFSTPQTLLMYVGPSLYGLVAFYVGLRFSLLLFVPLAIVAYFSVKYLRTP